MMKIAYYITGHGFGHATRSIELIRGLLQTGKYEVSVVSSLDSAFFTSQLNPYEVVPNSFHARCSTLDTGGVQLDAIRLDPFQSIESYYYQIHLNRDALLSQEVTWIKDSNIGLVLIDATPLASAIAYNAGIPSIYVTNFTWDFVFESMLQMVLRDNLAAIDTSHLQELKDMITQSQEDVARCNYVIHYPGQAPMNSLIDPTKIITGPMISRPVRNRNLRQELNIPIDAKLLLLGFGGHTAEWNLKDEHLPAGWHCLVLRADPSQMPSARFHVLPHESYVPDYIFAADVVLGKIGYGFVSECVNAGTALVYVPRVHWPEEVFLEDFLHTHNAGFAISFEDFEAGRWEESLKSALAVRRSWKIDSSHWLHSDDATASVISLIENYLQSCRGP